MNWIISIVAILGAITLYHICLADAESSPTLLSITGQVITWHELETLVKASLKEAGILATTPDLLIDTRDLDYFVMHPQSAQEVMKQVKINHPYQAQRFDCDDFSRVFFAEVVKLVNYPAEAGIAVADCSLKHWTPQGQELRHALNIILQTHPDQKAEILFFEPQKRIVLTLEKLKQEYNQVQIYRVLF